MSIRDHFSVSAATAFVLGGIAALVLATIVTLGGYGRGKTAPAGSSRGAASAAPSASGEYLLDVSEATDPSQLSP
jgi:hypothetical protein